MEFTLSDQDGHTVRIVVGNGKVQFNLAELDDVIDDPYWQDSFATFSSAHLIEEIGKMVATNNGRYLDIALHGDTHVTICRAEDRDDTVKLIVGAPFQDGAVMSFPVTVFQNLLDGGPFAPGFEKKGHDET